MQHEHQTGPPGAHPVSPFGEKGRLGDTWAITPGKTPERRHCTERIWSTTISGGRSGYHNIFACGVVTNAQERPVWHAVPQDGPQGGATTSLPHVTGLGAPAQSPSGEVPGRFWKGNTSPGYFPDTWTYGETGGSSQVPPCSSAFSIPSVMQLMGTRS